MMISNPASDNKPSVSVALITFNHAEYIEKAVESVLIQETDFDYEIIIGEDDSTDGTREIVIMYRDKYPDKIKLLLNDRKDVIYIDGKPTGRWNLINTLGHCKRKYIALLEGDDYWTDPLKLQKQVDFLEKNPDHSMCFHSVQFRSDERDAAPKIYEPYLKKKTYTLDELIQKNFIATLSVLYRNDSLYSNLPAWYDTVPVGDYPLHILTAERGKIGYIDEIMGVRRIHESGYWSAMNYEERFKASVKIRESVYQYFKGSQFERIARSTVYYSRYRYDYIRRKYLSAIVNLLACLAMKPAHMSVQSRGYIKSVLDIFLPDRIKKIVKTYF